MFTFVVTLVLFSAAFAGCIAESEGAEAPPPVNAGPASFDETTGAIEGTVTGEDLNPIAGAVVGILDTENQTLTDATGRFVFSNVAPGSVQVAASALGFASQGKRVDVEVGIVTQVQLVLGQVASDAPFMQMDVRKATMQALMWRVTPQCIYTDVNPLVKTCGGVRLDCVPEDACEVHYNDENMFQNGTDWKTIVGEVEWQPQSGATGRGFLFDINAPNVTRGTGGSINQASPYTFNQMQGKSPIIIRIDNPTTLEERKIPESDWYPYPGGKGCTAPDPDEVGNCDWFYRLFGAQCDASSATGQCGATPVDYGLAVDNTATIYMSFFFGEPATSDYTALPDS